MVTIELDYDRFKYKVTTFGQYVEKLHTFVGVEETDNIIVVVRLAKVKI